MDGHKSNNLSDVVEGVEHPKAIPTQELMVSQRQKLKSLDERFDCALKKPLNSEIILAK